MKEVKLRNVFFPIWLFFAFPPIILISLPINFIVDSIVLLLGSKVLKIKNLKSIYKKAIFKIFIFGFLADIIGALILLATQFVPGEFWYQNVLAPLMFNPFHTVFSFIYCAIAIIITGILIYLFNKKITFKNINLDEKTKKKLCIIIAIFTAPFFFLIPSTIFYNGMF